MLLISEPSLKLPQTFHVHAFPNTRLTDQTLLFPHFFLYKKLKCLFFHLKPSSNGRDDHSFAHVISLPSPLFLFVFCFDRGSHVAQAGMEPLYVAENDLELMIFLLLLPLDFRHTSGWSLNWAQGILLHPHE